MKGKWNSFTDITRYILMQFEISAIIYPKKKQKEHMVAFIKAYLDAIYKKYTTV